MKKKIKKNLWSGRFANNPSKNMENMNASIFFDKILFSKDIEASKAHANMLGNQKIISKKEAESIVKGLCVIEKEIKDNKMKFSAELEDIHTHIEKRLIKLIGNTAKKLHTARSRNDQVVTDLKIWIREECIDIDYLLKNLQKTLLDKADYHYKDIMPGFTHLQPAQPVTLGHHLLAYVNMFGRDRLNINSLSRHNLSPLGSAAIAGTTFNINRDETANILGFEGVMNNSMDAVSDRDFVLDTLNMCCSVFIHMSRIAEEIILWSSPGFNFILLSDKYSTGSSIMPQKKNPDAAELIRGKAGRIIGNYVALYNVMKALPLSYSKDMQEDKEPLFDSIKNTKKCLVVLSDLIKTTTFLAKKMKDMTKNGFITATDIADWLVKEKKMSFRDAHEITGKIVALAEKENKQLGQLKLNQLRKISPKITKDFYSFCSVESSVDSRSSYGGTSPLNVKKEITIAREKWLK